MNNGKESLPTTAISKQNVRVKMLLGDFLVLLGDLIFVIMAVGSVHYHRKYKNNGLIKLKDIGSSVVTLEKCYFGTFILCPIGLSVFYGFYGDPFDSRPCNGGRCIEAHNISWWIFGCILAISSIIINRLAKRALEIEKSRRPISNS